MKDDRVYLRHILRCIARIEEYTIEGRDTFVASPLVQDGVMSARCQRQPTIAGPDVLARQHGRREQMDIDPSQAAPH